MTVTINGTTGYSGPVGTIGDLTTTGNTTLGDASGDTLTLNGNTASIPNGLNFTNGNIGIGVTPSAWNSAYKALQFGTTGALFGESGDAAVYLACNSFIDSAGTAKYLTTDFASRYNQENGAHKWLTAASGTAGNAITFTTAMTLDASGNLGVGVTPSAWRTNDKVMQVGGLVYSGFVGAGYGVFYGNNFYRDSGGFKYIQSSVSAGRFDFDYTSGGAFAWNIAPSGTAGNAITFTQAMMLDASGNLGIGVTSPASRLDVGSSGSTKLFVRDRSDSDRGIYLDSGTSATGLALVSTNTASRALGFATNDTERARIHSNGYFSFFSTSTSGSFSSNTPRFYVSNSTDQYLWSTVDNSNANFYMARALTSGSFLYFGSNGNYVGAVSTNGSTTSYTSASDYRLKENVAPLTGALARVALLKPVTFKWVGRDSTSEGFIAHELQEVVPEAVVGEKDELKEDGSPAYQSVDTSFLVATLTAAIQELKADFDAYKLTHP